MVENTAAIEKLGKQGEGAVQYERAADGKLDTGAIKLAGGVDKDGKPTGTVISNVAPGSVAAGSTDAVNGGQLHATDEKAVKAQEAADAAQKVAGNSVQYDRNDDGSPNTGVIKLAGGTDASGQPTGTVLSNVAPGSVAAGSTDAVNGGQLHEVAQTAGKGWQLSAQGANASQVKPGDTVDIGSADANIAVTKGAADNNVKLALSRNLNVDSVTIPVAPTTADGTTPSGDAPRAVTLSAKGLDNGGNVLTGVGAGSVAAGSTDAVNGTQLAATDEKAKAAQAAADAADGKAVAADAKAVAAQETADAAQKVAGNGVQYDPVSDDNKEAKGRVTLGGPVSTDGGVTNGTRLTNVAQGSLAPNSTDAVNGTQLRATNQALATGLGGGAKLNDDGSVAAPSYIIHTPGSTTATATHDNVGAALGALDQGVVGNTAAIEKLGKQGEGAVQYGRDDAGKLDTGTIKLAGGVDKDGKPTGTVIGNVAPGSVAAGSTDAVNGGQLYATDEKAKAAQAAADAAQKVAGNSVQYDRNDDGSPNTGKINLAGGTDKDGKPTGTVIGNVAPGSVAAGSTDAVNGGQLHEVAQTAGKGWQLSAQGANASQVKPGDAVDISGDTNIGVTKGAADSNVTLALSRNLNVDSVTIPAAPKSADGTTPSGDAPRAVTLSAKGLDNGGNVLTGVGAGNVAVGSTDAVNGAQLAATDEKAKAAQTAADTADGKAVKAQEVADAAQKVAGNSVQYEDESKQSVKLGGPASTDGGKTGGTKLANVAQGSLAADSTEAVNGTQLRATNEALANGLGGGAKLNDDGSVAAPSYTIHTPGSTTATVKHDNVGAALGALDQGVTGNTAAIEKLGKQGEGAVQYGRDADGKLDTGTIRLAGGVDKDGKPTGQGTVISNVGAGNVAADSTEAVNGAQLHATDEKAKAAQAAADTADSKAVKAQEAADAADGKAVAADEKAMKAQVAADAAQKVAGNGVQYDPVSDDNKEAKGRVTLGGPVSTDGGMTNGTRLTNVAQGSLAPNSTDAVNGTQLRATNQALATGLGGGAKLNDDGSVAAPSYVIHTPGSTTATNAHDNVGAALGALDQGVTGNTAAIDKLGKDMASGAVGPVQQTGTAGQLALVASGSTGAEPGAAQQLTNVAAGKVAADSTDAVNGAQLHDTNQQVAQTANNVAGNTRAIETLKEGQSANSNQIANLSQGIENGTVGLVRQEGGSPGDGRITIGSMTGGTSISLAGTSGNRTLSGVADGKAADDAVSVSQLAAAISNASMNAVHYDGADRGSVTFNAGGAPSALRNVAAGRLDAASTDAVNGGQLHATNERVAAHATQLASLETGQAGAFRANNQSGLPAPDVRGADAVAGGFGAVASGARSTAIGSNAVASGMGSVALGHGSTDGGRDNVVSIGSEGAERQIANVAAGTRPTDAANVGQLNSAVGNALGSANAYTDQRVNALSFDLANVRRDADAGTASAMAIAGLPQAFESGGGMIGGAIGVYQNETAFALGVSKVFNDGRTVVKGGATYVETSRGATFGGNVGIGYQF